MELILASNSPRRSELLTKAGCSFRVIASDYEEKFFSLDPVITAETFAFNKANSVFNKIRSNDVLVLGADTVVFLDGKILGKSQSEDEAKKMLKLLSDKEHSVTTGYVLISKDNLVKGSVTTKVKFNKLTDEMIEDYIKSGLYKGKAGSYGIQDGYQLVKEYKGSLSNVIGLPIETVVPIIKKILGK